MRRGLLFNGRFLSQPLSGVQRVAWELVRGVDRRLAAGGGPPCELVAPPMSTPLPANLKAIRARTAGPLKSQAWEQLELPLLARSRVLVNLCNVAPLAAGGGVLMIHDAQVFLSPQSYSRAFGAWYRFALPRLARSAARILTVSEYSKAQIVRYGLAAPEKITVIPNGADHFHRVEPDGGIRDRLDIGASPYVVALASTQAHKNIGVLLQAFRRPELAGLRLVLVGSADAATMAAAQLTPPPNAVFAGRCSDGQFKALLQGAVCLAFPSRTEGFGLPPVEAMAVECPAVVAPCGALPEVCGDAALYADPDVPEAWAAAILRLHEDPALRRRMIDAGRARAALFTWDGSAGLLLELVTDLADGNTDGR